MRRTLAGNFGVKRPFRILRFVDNKKFRAENPSRRGEGLSPQFWLANRDRFLQFRLHLPLDLNALHEFRRRLIK